MDKHTSDVNYGRTYHNHYYDIFLECVNQYLAANYFRLAKSSLQSAKTNGAPPELLQEYEANIKMAEAKYEERKEEYLKNTKKHLQNEDTEGANRCLKLLLNMQSNSSAMCSTIQALQTEIMIVEKLKNIEEFCTIAQDLLLKGAYSEANSKIRSAKSLLGLSKEYLSKKTYEEVECKVFTIEMLTEAERYMTYFKIYPCKSDFDKINNCLRLAEEGNIMTEIVNSMRQKLEAFEGASKFKTAADVYTSLSKTQFVDDYNASKNSLVAEDNLPLAKHVDEINEAARNNTNMKSDSNDYEFDIIVENHGNALEYKCSHYDNFVNTENIHNRNDDAYGQTQDNETVSCPKISQTKTGEEPKTLNSPSITEILKRLEKKINFIHQPTTPIAKGLLSPALVYNVNSHNPNAPFSESHTPSDNKFAKAIDKCASKPEKPSPFKLQSQTKANTNAKTAKIPESLEAEKQVSLGTPTPGTFSNTLLNSQKGTYESNYEKSINKGVQPTQPETTCTATEIDGHFENPVGFDYIDDNKQPISEAPATKNIATMTCAEKCGALVLINLESGKIKRAARVLAIAEKLYPYHDYALIRNDVFAAKQAYYSQYEYNNKENNNGFDNLATGVQNIKLNNNNETKRSNLSINTVTAKHQTEKYYNQEKAKTVYAYKSKEKSVINYTDLKNSYDDDDTNNEPQGNVNGNKDSANECLELAKVALENKDYEKAEKLAKKSDRMIPSEEAKALLVKVFTAKRSARYEVKNNYKKRENQEVSQENAEQASQCFKKAMEANEEENYDKCKRLLEKAKRLDNNIQIDCYLAKLQEKKEQDRIAEERIQKEKIEKERIEIEKAAKQAEIQRKSEENPGLFSSIVRKGMKTWNSVIGGEDTAVKKYHDNSDPRNKKGQNEKKAKKSAETGNILKTDSGSNMDVDDFENINIEDIEMSEMNASGSAAGSNSEEEMKKAKSQELVNKALKCNDERDFVRAEELLIAAIGVYPSQETRDILHQIKECSGKLMTRKTTNQENKKPTNQEKTAENAATKNMAEENRNQRSSSAYEDNQKHLDKFYFPTRTSYSTTFFEPTNNQERGGSYNLRPRPNRSKSRDDPGRKSYQDDSHGRGRGYNGSNNNQNDHYNKNYDSNSPSQKSYGRNTDQHHSRGYVSGYGNNSNQNNQALGSNDRGTSSQNEWKADDYDRSVPKEKLEMQGGYTQIDNYNRSSQSEKVDNCSRSSQIEKRDDYSHSSQSTEVGDHSRASQCNFEGGKLDCNENQRPGCDHSCDNSEAKLHLDLGKEDYKRHAFENAEKHFVTSEQMHPSAEARHWLTLVRKAKNEKSSIDFQDRPFEH